MNYELAKKLKEAGFPQKYKTEVITENGITDEHSANEQGYEYAFIPSLSELIDFVDGTDKLQYIENDYVQKALLKLQSGKDK